MPVLALAAGVALGAVQSQAQTITPTNPGTPNASSAPTMPAVPPEPVSSAPLSPQGQQALENAPSGTSIQWKNPDGASATIVPQPAFQTANGQICREFQQTVTIGGRPQQAYGTACRQPDGTWKLQAVPDLPPAQVTANQPAVYPAPPVAYAYPPGYFAPGYYYPRPYYSSGIFIGVGGGHHRHWR
jgi:hypothetical protein